GIPQFIERADLMDRTISIEMQTIPDHQKKDWESVSAAFEVDRPKILVGLFTIISKALAGYPFVKPSKLPRLAGLGKIMWAAEKHLGWEEGEFQRIWDSNT